MEKIKAAILGPSGMVGRVGCVELANHPYFDVIGYYGDKSAGHNLGMAIKEREVRLMTHYGAWKELLQFPKEFYDIKISPLNINGLVDKNVKVAFSLMKKNAETWEIEQQIAARGIKVFSNMGEGRMLDDILLGICDINGDKFDSVKGQKSYKNSGGYIVKNTNCTTAGLVVSLKPIIDYCKNKNIKIENINVFTSQALSGKGDDAYPKGLIERNTIYKIKDEEKKVKEESSKILGIEIHKIVALCTRSDIQNGHGEGVIIRTDKLVDMNDLKEYIDSYDPLEDYNLPTHAKPLFIMEDNKFSYELPNHREVMERIKLSKGISVGMVRLTQEDKVIKYDIVSDNLRRGAILQSIYNAEYMAHKGLI